MRKEVTAAFDRIHHRNERSSLSTATRSVLRPGIQLIALASIFGVSAYLLFVPDVPDLHPVRVAAKTPPHIQSPSIQEKQLNPLLALPGAEDGNSSASTFQLVAGLPTVLEKANTEQKDTADHLLRFITTGEMAEIRAVTSDQVESLAQLFADQLGEETLAAAAESYFGLPASQLLAQERPASALADLFEAIRNDAGPTNVAPVVFTDHVETDGRIDGNVHVIPSGTKRVYAAFENAGALQGLNRVLAVWRNPSNDRMMFTEYEPIRTGSVYNYVWLELDDGWPDGFYQLDLYHPSRTSELLASRGFNVR